MDEPVAAVALRHMLKAVKCCHDNHMGHNDIKPENFMYQDSDLCCLQMIDLGMSSPYTCASDTLRGTPEYMAPEVWDGIYGPECDVWSCGAVLFLMLTGHPVCPMGVEDPNKVKKFMKDRMAVRKRLSWAAETKGISTEALHLLRAMLTHDRHLRPSVAEALNHPFIVNSYMLTHYRDDVSARADRVIDALVTGFNSYAEKPVLKRAALLLLAHLHAYSSEEMEAHRLAYARITRLGTGRISMDCLEIYYAYQQQPLPDDLADAFAIVDTDNDGYITFLEFLAATLPKEMVANEGLCHVIFTRLDRQRKGCIVAADLASTFATASNTSNATLERVCQQALEEVVGLSTGTPALTWEQFYAMMCTE